MTELVLRVKHVDPLTQKIEDVGLSHIWVPDVLEALASELDNTGLLQGDCAADQNDPVRLLIPCPLTNHEDERLRKALVSNAATALLTYTVVAGSHLLPPHIVTPSPQPVRFSYREELGYRSRRVRSFEAPRWREEEAGAVLHADQREQQQQVVQLAVRCRALPGRLPPCAQVDLSVADGGSGRSWVISRTERHPASRDPVFRSRWLLDYDLAMQNTFHAHVYDCQTHERRLLLGTLTLHLRQVVKRAWEGVDKETGMFFAFTIGLGRDEEGDMPAATLLLQCFHDDGETATGGQQTMPANRCHAQDGDHRQRERGPREVGLGDQLQKVTIHPSRVRPAGQRERKIGQRDGHDRRRASASECVQLLTLGSPAKVASAVPYPLLLTDAEPSPPPGSTEKKDTAGAPAEAAALHPLKLPEEKHSGPQHALLAGPGPSRGEASLSSSISAGAMQAAILEEMTALSQGKPLPAKIRLMMKLGCSFRLLQPDGSLARIKLGVSTKSLRWSSPGSTMHGKQVDKTSEMTLSDIERLHVGSNHAAFPRNRALPHEQCFIVSAKNVVLPLVADAESQRDAWVFGLHYLLHGKPELTGSEKHIHAFTPLQEQTEPAEKLLRRGVPVILHHMGWKPSFKRM